MLIPTPDGRTLQVLDEGGDGLPCLFHNGTPGGAFLNPVLRDAARQVGVRLVTYARPGYGESTALPGRTVAQAAQDSATVLDHLGVDELVLLGGSGGGPHALACAALLPHDCLAVAAVASIAPGTAEGLDLFAGMGEGNVVELTAALAGREALEAYLAEEGDPPGDDVTGAQVVAGLAGLLCDADLEALTPQRADAMLAGLREALRTGTDGWRDDDLALMGDWGFDLGAVTVPTALWQGTEDRMVPVAHGRWLAERLPQAVLHVHEGDGHASVWLTRVREVLADLVRLAGTS